LNTKLIMILSAAVLGITGMTLTFMPAEILAYAHILAAKPLQFVLQAAGALYIGFAMLNWMSKGAVIGGIYNKPIALANFTHFFMVSMACIHALIDNPKLPLPVWIFTVTYIIFAQLFGLISFRHPVAGSQSKQGI